MCCKCSISQRWFGCTLVTLVIITAYAIRVSTHLTLIRMVKNATRPICAAPRSIGMTRKIENDINSWSEPIQGWIIAIFYIGYTALYFPSYFLVQHFRPRWVLSTSTLISVICSALIPVSVDKLGYGAMMALRFLQGVGQAVLFPAIRVYLVSWIVPMEGPVASSVIFSGTPIGSTMGIIISGLILYIFNNWRFVYYFWAIAGFILYIFLVIYLYSDPSSHRCINAKEEEYIQENIKPKKIRSARTPYVKMMKDNAIIASIIGEIGHVTILFFFVNDFPKFMGNILSYPVIDNCVVSSIPYLAPLMISILAGKLSDWGIGVKEWDLGFTRKSFVVVATAVASFFLLGVGYMLCDDVVVIMFIAFTMFLLGFHFPGLKINTLDLTSQHAGFGSALQHGISGIIGIIQPLICAYAAPDGTKEQWIIIFWIFCVIALISTFIFFVMGSGKRRRWDYSTLVQKYFKTKVQCFSIYDGDDKDEEAVRHGPERERYEEMLEYRRKHMH